MTSGIILSVLTGLIWAAVSVCASCVSRKNYSGSGFYAVGTCLSALVCFLVWLPSHEGWRLVPKLLGYFVVAASSNGILQLILMVGQKKNNCALFCSIGQTTFVWSFLMMVLFFGDVFSGFNIVGLVLIAGAVIASALVNSCGGARDSLLPSPKDAAMAVFGAMLGGLCSVCLLRAGQIEGAPVMLKTGIHFLCGTVFHLVNILVSKQKFSAREKMAFVKYGAGWSVLAITSYICIFAATASLAPYGRTSIIHVIANSLNIFFFWLYSVIFLKTGTSRLQVALMSLLIIGLIVFKLG